MSTKEAELGSSYKKACSARHHVCLEKGTVIHPYIPYIDLLLENGQSC